jgi:hypothetical protein
VEIEVVGEEEYRISQDLAVELDLEEVVAEGEVELEELVV